MARKSKAEKEELSSDQAQKLVDSGEAEIPDEAKVQDPSYEEVKKSPEIEHAKKLAKAAAKAKKLVKPSKTFYTIKDGKVLKVAVNVTGAFSSFVYDKRKKDKTDKNFHLTQVKKWKSEKLWVSEEDYQEHCEKIKDELAKEA
jgi:hypothetical protein